jgi:hypothetical protein
MAVAVSTAFRGVARVSSGIGCGGGSGLVLVPVPSTGGRAGVGSAEGNSSTAAPGGNIVPCSPVSEP